MKKRFSKLLVSILALTMIVTSFPVNLLTTKAAENKVISAMTDSVSDADSCRVGREELQEENLQQYTTEGGVEAEITRAQWLSMLAGTFGMTVEDDYYPDNYFSDLDSSSEYYYDVLLNVEFGVVDVETGGEIRPDDPATREFAAHTLNFCLGYQMDQATAAVCSDIDDSPYKEDLYIAVNRGWFELVDGEFLPEQGITQSEADIMLADAEEILISMEVDPDAENIYELAEDVIVLTKECDSITVDEEGIYTILVTDLQQNIVIGNRFAIYQDTIPTVFVAESVSVNSNVTTITAVVDESANAYTDVSAEGIVCGSVANVEALDGAELVFVDEETEEEYDSAEEMIALYGAHSKKLKNSSVVVKKKVKFGDEVSGEIKLKLKNAKVTYDVQESKLAAYAYLECDTELSFSCNMNLDGYSPINDLRLVNWTVPGVGGFVVEADLDLKAAATGIQKGYLKTGIDISKKNGVRLIRGFEAKSFSLVAQASADMSLEAKLGITELPILKAYGYAKIGGVAEATRTEWTDSSLPRICVDFNAYLYAKFGFYGELKFLGFESSFSIDKTIINEKNSPIRCVKHYDDGIEVTECARDAVEEEGGEEGTTTKKKRYVTPANSSWSGSYWGSGTQSAGKDESGTPIPMYTYSVNSDEETVTITGYKGSATSLVIPGTLDGYKVTVIGSEAFLSNTKLRMVVIPNSVTGIATGAFEKCVNLTSVVFSDNITSIAKNAFKDCASLTDVRLPKSLTYLGYMAFGNCDSITKIEIPKNLSSVGVESVWLGGGPNYRDGGPFTYCDNLKEVSFEEGMQTIPANVLTWCVGLKKVVIPGTVIVINGNAFQNCYNLKTVDLPDSITAIGPSAFSNCYALADMELPKYLQEIGEYAFNNCDSLTYLEIPKTLTSLWFTRIEWVGAFTYCDSLKEVKFEEGTTTILSSILENSTAVEKVTIPDTVNMIDYMAFYNCQSLTDITIPNSVTTIRDHAFKYCYSLENIIIPDSVKTIGSGAFEYCTSLKEIVIPDSVTSMRGFGYCSNLEKITLSKNLTCIDYETFSYCNKLKNIIIPENVKEIGRCAFQGAGLEEITLPENVENIGEAAFNSCTSLVKVSLNENLTDIGKSAFSSCDALTSIIIPDSVTFLGEYVFADCDLLSDVKLGAGITEIPSYAFNMCSALEKIVLPYRVAKIKNNAFANCTKLTEVTVPRATKAISSAAFSYPNILTIYGVAGTYVEEYAGEIGANFVNKEINASNVALGSSELTLNKGDTVELEFTITPADFTDEVIWKSSEPSIVTVDEVGIVTAKEAGTATIKMTVGNVSASCTITVLQPVTSIGLDTGSLSIGALESYQLEATVYPINANNQEILWSSSDENIATVTEDGLVSAHKKGSCTITAMATDGSDVKRTCSVTVTSNAYIVDEIEKLQSSHPYENNCTDVWQYTLAGAKSLAVTFDADTYMEDGYDLLYLMDRAGNYIGVYTCDELSGKTILVEGDTIRIRLDTDSSSNEYGFKVTDVQDMSSNIQYSIVFDKNNVAATGEMSEQTMEYMSGATLAANAFKLSGYTFKGWNTKADGTGTAYANRADGSYLSFKNGTTVTLYAQWEKNIYKITYKLNGGKNHIKNPSTYTVTTESFRLKNPTKEGYTFNGWYSDSKLTKKVTQIAKGSSGNKILYAKWQANKYAIKFNANGGKGTMATMNNRVYGKSYKLKANAFKRSGYTFNGWNTKKNGSGKSYKNKANVKSLVAANGKSIVLYAQWKEVDYKITYKLNGGKNNTNNPKTYTVTTAITLKNPTRSGYVFKGWYSDSKFTKKVTKISKGSTGNKTLYAKWVKK